MALKLVKGIQKPSERDAQRKSREEYLIACLRDEANDVKFSDWERDFILSLARQMGRGRKLTEKQKLILERLWQK